MQPAYPQWPGFPLPFKLKRPTLLPAPPPDAETAPDHQTQLEELLNTVWDAEANWRLDDRIDLALGKRRSIQH